MKNSHRVILILIIVAVSLSIPRAIAQTSDQVSLTLVGQNAGHYVAPAGETTEMKLQILNAVPRDIYLVLGEAYLDPHLNGNWKLIHSEDLGNFHLGYLQSAVWTFSLTIPIQIHAANVTNGIPQVALLIKITYQTASGQQGNEQNTFVLSVPGATLQGQNNTIWLAAGGILLIISLGAAFVLVRRRRVR